MPLITPTAPANQSNSLPWGQVKTAADNHMPPVPAPTAGFPIFKVIDLGELSSDKFESILEQMSRAWGKEIAPFMADKPKSFKEQLKSDATNAAYRVGSSQLINVTKNFLVQFVRKSCSEESKIRAVSELLDTEIGTALMAMFIGFSVSQIPQLSNNPKMQRILKEFRVGGMATVGNAAVEAVLVSMLPIIASAIQEIQKAEIVEKIEESSLEEDILAVSELEKAAPLLRQS